MLGPRSCGAAKQLMREAQTPAELRKLKSYDALHAGLVETLLLVSSWSVVASASSRPLGGAATCQL